jgi:L-2-hydroxyglutarate oxidase LhgO
MSTAWQLQQRKPDSRILLIEKEKQLAHTLGFNGL